jgi:hypothetical protein
VSVFLYIIHQSFNKKEVMKNEEKKVYLAPEVEVLEVAVESGFAASGGDYPQWGDEIPL